MKWSTLPNPRLEHNDYSFKDAALVHDGSQWIIACSAFDEERSSIMIFSSRDGADWQGPLQHWDGRDDGWIGLCSPDIIRHENQWIMTYNSWGDTSTERHNRCFYRTSTDLKNFSKPQALAHELLNGVPIIDAALAYAHGNWFLACNLTKEKSTRIAYANSLYGPWQWVGQGAITLADTSGAENGLIHENYQFLHIDAQWHLLCTDYRPHAPWLYRLLGNPATAEAWEHWGDGYELAIDHEAWNSIDKINASALWDHRPVDGYFYAIYGGKNAVRADEFNGCAGRKPWPRGWNKLGLARSQNLIDWELPGAVQH